jgi:DnaJ-class molecular chaperone
MKPKDYYKILGIDKTASQEEVKKAYREKSHAYHPDKTDANEEKTRFFIEVGEAYNVLGDMGKRRKYDNTIETPTRVKDKINDFQSVHNTKTDEDIFETIFFGNIEHLFSEFYQIMFGVKNQTRGEKRNSGGSFNYRHYDDLLK